MRVYLGLGSNLGSREEYLRAALHGLSDRSIKVVKCASVYATQPRDLLDQPWFLNTAVEANTALDPHELLVRCLQIEEENHRTRDSNKGPRTLDIDIIFYGNEILRQRGLTIPHPSFSTRRFVLLPLDEIAADYTDPLSLKTIRDLLVVCGDQGEVRRVSPPLQHFF